MPGVARTSGWIEQEEKIVRKTSAWIAAATAVAIAGTVEAGAKKPRKLTAAEMQKVEQMDEDGLIVYEPEGEVWQTVTVWTNVDCGQCKKLHKQMDRMGRMGIRVRYAAWPWLAASDEHIRERNVRKMEAVWCAPDQHREMDQAKQGRPLTPRQCDNPMAEQRNVAKAIGLIGVPTLVTESGELWVAWGRIRNWLNKAERQKRRMDRRAEKARQKQLESGSGQSRVEITDMSDGR